VEDKTHLSWSTFSSSRCDVADFSGGIVYLINFLLAFYWGSVLEYDHQEMEELDGPRVAKAYML
jgi:hypothetical protein